MGTIPQKPFIAARRSSSCSWVMMNGQGVSLTSAIRPACPVATPLPLRSQHASYRIAGVRDALWLWA